LYRSNVLGMRAQFVIPVLVSILVLGTLGLSQVAFSVTTVIDTDTTIEDLKVGKNDLLIVNAELTITGELENSGIIFVNGFQQSKP